LVLKSVPEVKEFIKDLLGNTEAANKFSEEFVKRRKGLVAGQPSSPAITKSASAEKNKKKKNQKVSANHLLGFTVFNPNQGEIETLDE
jgi:hypothetical protein